jgi:hypothetical protein
MTAFALEVLRAREGDCLLLHHGGKLILIDGGPRGVYEESLRPRLRELIAAQPAGRPLWLQMIMVSHIDDDHIVGLKELFAEAVERRERHADEWRAGELWFNALGPLTGASGVPAPPGAESQAITASVPNGSALEAFAHELSIELNVTPFGGGVVQSTAGAAPVEVLPGLTFTVLAPAPRRLERLRTRWAKWEAEQDRDAETAAILDTTVFNVSSIVVLAESAGRTMLLTGDARGDDIIDGLVEHGRLAADGPPFIADVLKLPHHGSERNVDEHFFARVRARHYVISADGRHDNPDARTLTMLCDSRRGETEPWTLWLTYGGAPGDGREGLAERLAAFFAARRDVPGLQLRYAQPGQSLTITL